MAVGGFGDGARLDVTFITVGVRAVLLANFFNGSIFHWAHFYSPAPNTTLLVIGVDEGWGRAEFHFGTILAKV